MSMQIWVGGSGGGVGCVCHVLNKQRVFTENKFKVFICKRILRFVLIKRISSGSGEGNLISHIAH